VRPGGTTLGRFHPLTGGCPVLTGTQASLSQLRKPRADGGQAIVDLPPAAWPGTGLAVHASQHARSPQPQALAPAQPRVRALLPSKIGWELLPGSGLSGPRPGRAHGCRYLLAPTVIGVTLLASIPVPHRRDRGRRGPVADRQTVPCSSIGRLADHALAFGPFGPLPVGLGSGPVRLRPVLMLSHITHTGAGRPVIRRRGLIMGAGRTAKRTTGPAGQSHLTSSTSSQEPDPASSTT
jgi:hypothetical protein